MRLVISKQKFIDYALLYLLIAVSGIPFFNGDIPLLGALGLSVLVFLLRRQGFHGFYLFVVFSFLTLVLLHGLRFNYLPYSTIVGMVIKISLGYFVIAILKEKFTAYYVDIMCVLAVISFFFFIPLFITPAFESIFNSIAVPPPFGGGSRGSLLVYNLNLDRPGGMYRNCGAFWEPAAYGGFLLIAFMFNLARTNSLKDKRSLILLITSISTLSTTVFVILALLIFFYFFFNQGLGVKLTVVPIMVIGFYVAFFNLDFLYSKIMLEIQKGDKQQTMRQFEESGHSRLSSGFADFNDFKKYPVIGRGIYELTFYNKADFKDRHNGLTRFIAQFGIIGSLIYFFGMYKSFSRLVSYSYLHSLMRFVFFGAILAMGVSENFFIQPYFWGLIFLHLIIHSEEDVLKERHEEEQVAVA